MEEKFKDILNSGEKISKVLRPNRLAFVGGPLSLLLVTFGPVLIILYIVWMVFSTDKTTTSPTFTVCVIMSILSLIAFILTWIITAVLYKNTFYAITNKRLIIRTGIMGIDYKSMDLSDISAVEPKVGVWDKVSGQHTGSILIGSPTRPIIVAQQNTVGGGTFKFANVLKPYEVAKQIKELSDKAKSGNSKTEKTKQNTKLVDQVKELDKLRKSGVINEKEYKKMKDKIIQDL